MCFQYIIRVLQEGPVFIFYVLYSLQSLWAEEKHLPERWVLVMREKVTSHLEMFCDTKIDLFTQLNQGPRSTKYLL